MRHLCHYTSGHGLLGILDSHSVWASNIHQLNDAQEFRHAFGLAEEALRRIVHGAEARPQALVASLCDILDRWKLISVHVASFSEDGDSLSQWRGYCPDGFGYCLEFDPASLTAAAERAGFELKPCIYDEAIQRQLVGDWATICMELALRWTPEGDGDAALVARCHDHIVQLVLKAPYLKHPSFAAEREWRMVKVVEGDDPALRVRAGKSMLIRYVPIPVDLSPGTAALRNICIGPAPDPELAAEGITFYFHRTCLRSVTYSKVPYRAW